MGIPHEHDDTPEVHSAADLTATIERLTLELEELRGAARTSAVVEQAKGVLTERLGCGPAAAHSHLLQIARDSDIAPAAAARLLLTPVGDDEIDPQALFSALRPAVPRPRPASRPERSDGGPGVDLDQAQRLGNLGWGWWDLAKGRNRWSDRLYLIFGRAPSEGPLPLERLPEAVVYDDVPLAVHLVRTLMDGSETVDNELRVLRGEESRDVRLMAEPVLDALGKVVAVRCLCQDVTRWRRGERALKASYTQLERRLIAEERHQAIEMQRSILPLPEGIVTKPGLRAAVRYLPAGSSARVGGDWYETTAIDGAGVFLAIGDVSGHGLPAAAAMARLRNGLSGLAFSGASPDRLLGWLNIVALHWPTSLTATVFAGRYDPETRILTWSQGGHFPPVLIRDGKAATLVPPEGVLLGAVESPEFGIATTALEPGDMLLLYTDGLIERRDRDLQEGLDLLVHVASSVDADDPERVLDHVLQCFGAPNPNDDTCVVAIQIE